MSPVGASIVGVALLIGTLAFAIIRPKGLPEAVAAVPAALIALLLGLISWHTAGATVDRLASTIGFLAAVLVIAHLCDVDGVFRWLGTVMARRSRSDPKRLLLLVFIVASLTTAALSLDATVVLLTPAVLATIKRLKVAPAPHVYATAHLSNTASLVLPVSNLTNLLAFQASGLTFLGFTALMAGPWLVAIAVEYGVFRLFFRSGLQRDQAAATPEIRNVSVPTVTLVLLALILTGFAAGPLIGAQPALVAAVGAAVMAIRAIARGQVGLWTVIKETNPLFLAFVAALGVVVDAATGHGLQTALGNLLPLGSGLLDLLALAVIAAVLSNLVNNLPATLVLLAALGPHPQAAPVLAVLIGVNIGPNLTYTGSLATLLWRRVLLSHSTSPSLGRFTRLGLLTVPASLVAATVALWAGTQL
ncbi:arsenical pump membrane protein [Nakamurella panacisegetis]|uniref:Arsenical pump membrane protein n=1 Tax=Nakamurella panacisegetis TaxID=1090615 RepID=A0A1H0R033_9ACTN|nr:SLC13 family permease [Nakamurella panacisegetis]SDP22549.1 arsenical pump membrane protein [Nakamurella panacisegetis]